ncbi:hypothetical protein [Ruegeria sp. HKCCD7559]|uniref:hypothetical protein n=1 Tax=Ruegeria sp. HKCCD7559 TaxID=2683005 RepID=UPI0014927FC0|nr:hypothetical protein [Ruegeria sp. HKCCD7559]NOC47702.1 hypothetical protein [Ruegeria sp. HKCCD7559]
MRKRIRLTGRKQLARSAVEAKVVEVGGKKLVSMTIADPKAFKKMPDTARVKLRLFENKFSETLEFGTLGAMKTTAEIKSGAFSAPSCQLRVVATNNEQKGLLLGSTDTWTMRTGGDDQDGTASEGILLFQPHEIAPRTWKLDVREDDYPIVYIDKKIPDSRTWVRNDPIFVSCVLPAIIREVFDDILFANAPPEQAWAKDWLGWADTLMPGRAIPWTDGRQQKQVWVNDLLDSFCQRHGVLEMLVGKLKQETIS